MRGCCECPAGMLLLCPCCTPDVSSPLCRFSPSAAPTPRTLSLTTSVCQAASGFNATLTLQTLRSPSVSAESNLPPSSFPFLFNLEILLSLLKHSRPDPAPTSPKPPSLVRLSLNAPLPLCLPLVSSPQSALNTKRRQLSARCPGAPPEGVTCISDAPTVSGAPAGNADPHLSAQQIQRPPAPPTPRSDSPCLMDRQHETKAEREGKEAFPKDKK